MLRERATDLLARLSATAGNAGSTLLLGMPDRNEKGQFVNSAIAIGSGEGRYVKRRLLPFGEYIPMQGLLRGLIKVFDLPMSDNHVGKHDQPLLLAGDLTLAMSICYEIVFPDLVRNYPRSADLLVTISNDTWFGASIGPLQHMQMARMRALENGRYLIRATNNGVSALVDHQGKVVKSIPQFVPGVLRGEVLKMEGTTPYARFGAIPVLLLIALLMLGQKIWQCRETHSGKAAVPGSGSSGV
jgi:apolipoprotein N-acyltransferase